MAIHALYSCVVVGAIWWCTRFTLIRFFGYGDDDATVDAGAFILLLIGGMAMVFMLVVAFPALLRLTA